MTDDQMKEDLKKAKENLDAAIKAFFHTQWAADGDEDNDNTIIVHWAVPVFYRQFGPHAGYGYTVATAPEMALHEVRGLLKQADGTIISIIGK